MKNTAIRRTRLFVCGLFAMLSYNCITYASSVDYYDVCPDGDYSPSAYDNTCEGQNISHYTSPIHIAVKVSKFHNAAEAQETCNWNRPSFDCLLERGRAIGLTNATNKEEFKPYTTITRQEAARYINAYSNMFGLATTDYSIDCRFGDIGDADSSFMRDVVESCQKGLFAGSHVGGSFLPKSTLTQAQTVTVLVKMLIGQQKGNGPWYTSYYTAFEKLLPHSDYQMDTHYKNMTRGDLLKLLFTLRYSQ